MPSSKGVRKVQIGDNGGPPINSWGEKGATPAQLKATKLLGGPQRHTCLVGGARSGKTTTLVRTIMLRAIRFPGSRHVILRFRAVHADASVALDTIPKVMKMCFPSQGYKHVKSPHNLIRLPNGSEVWIGGLDDAARVDKILGNEYATIFLNECSQISWYSAKLVRSRLAQVIDGCTQRMLYDINPVGKSHWTNQLFGLKVDPDNGRTPLGDPENYERMFINPIDNAQNLDAGYVKELENSTGNYNKRFFKGEYIDEVNNALWTLDLIEACRVNPGEEPEFVQTVIAIDPSGASEAGDSSDIEMKPLNDEIGIIVASLGKDQKVYLRADLSLVAGPIGQGIDPETGQKRLGWAEVAVAAYHYYKADHILAEINYGGGMVEAVIRAQDGNVPVKTVRASTGKHIRAEPVSTLYTRDGVRHVGQFPQLEDQLCAFTSLGYGGAKSPDRADAWVWAVTDIALQDGANNWIEYYRRLNEKAGTLPEQQADEKKPEFGYAITPPDANKKHRVLVPEGISTLFLIDGTSMLVPVDRIVSVSAEDATAFGMRGWERLAA
ncbi:phage terminase large subunit [Bradyrhizobium erythrophlei]|uniref:Terminase-like family protein n=1 Tax=Bradyrhizobium erythrophlei TaxID=1437360 RepID=A0A1M5NPY3_9BRAD|nr:phage terminase large subunit [Bradyrhizobium erythrophlei]SHG91013.1 Terminase-like family protein [Bradyrhizobium erythrophlei]